MKTSKRRGQKIRLYVPMIDKATRTKRSTTEAFVIFQLLWYIVKLAHAEMEMTLFEMTGIKQIPQTKPKWILSMLIWFVEQSMQSWLCRACVLKHPRKPNCDVRTRRKRGHIPFYRGSVHWPPVPSGNQTLRGQDPGMTWAARSMDPIEYCCSISTGNIQPTRRASLGRCHAIVGETERLL